MSDLISKVLKIAEDWCQAHLDCDPTTELLTTHDLDEQTRTAHLAAASRHGERFALNVQAESGWDGTPFSNGLRSRLRDTPDYDRPLVARGLGHDLGRLEQLARTSPQWQRVIENADNLVLNARFEYDPAPQTFARYPDAAELERDSVQAALSRLQGGVRAYLRESVQSLLTAGWSLHVVVDALDGTIRQLAPRRPSTVRRWLLNSDETELLGVEFVDRWGGLSQLAIEHTLIASWRPFGLDLEGVPPIRTAAPWIVAKQMIAQLWHARIKKYAMPVAVIESGEVSDTSDDRLLVSLWDTFTADDYPVVTLKRGQKISSIDLHATPSEFEAALRYCDEQILLPLASEGALLGLNRVGAYNLADSKEGSEIAQSITVAQRAVDALNGADSYPWTGAIPRLVRNAFGGPMTADCYPSLRLAVGEDDVPLADVLAALNAGLLPITDEVRAHLAARLRMPIPPPQDDDKALVAAGDVQESALNGAQVASLLKIIGDVKAGLIDVENAVQAAMISFQVDEETARALVAPTNGVTPPEVTDETT